MANRYIIHMSKSELPNRIPSSELATIATKHTNADARLYTSAEDALIDTKPLAKFYGLTVLNVEFFNTLQKFGSGATCLVGQGKNRYLYIIKVDDRHQGLKRLSVGK